jgi:hypothetical protein
MKQLITIDEKQSFYFGKIFFLLLGLMFIFFAGAKSDTIYYSPWIMFLFGMISLLLWLKLRYFIKNKAIIYSFLGVVTISNAIYAKTLGLPFISVISFTVFLIIGFFVIFKIKELPGEDLRSKKIPVKSLIPFFLITLVATAALFSFIFWVEFF